METLLIVAIIVTALSVMVQAGALLGMYLLSRRVSNNVNSLINETHKLVAPLENVATNFKAASDVLVEIGKDGREELHHIHAMVTETSDSLRGQVQDLHHRLNQIMDDLHATVMTPVRECSAIASGISAGFRTLFRRRAASSVSEEDVRKTPA